MIGLGCRVGTVASLALLLGCGDQRDVGVGLATVDLGLVGEGSTPQSASGLRRVGVEGRNDSDDRRALRFAYVRGRQAEGAADLRFHVRREEGVLVAASPERRVEGRFEREGIEVVSAATSGWLRTRSIRCDARRVVTNGSPFGAAGAPHRVERAAAHGEISVTEWVESGPLGLEHGFDVDGRCDELELEVEVEGLRVERVGDDLRLASSEGAFRYADLLAVDQTGRSLPARFSMDARDRVSLVVDTHDAAWPVVVDPLLYSEEQVVSLEGPGSDGVVEDRFGNVVAMAGDTAVVGAPQDHLGALDSAGSVYVFVRTGGAWELEAKLIARDYTAFAAFGRSVALSGDTLLVGAENAAYAFVRTGSTWRQQVKIHSPRGTGVRFGEGVALEGDTGLVAAPSEDAGAGAVHVFVRSGTTWSVQARLVASDRGSGDFFGASVALSGSTALIGATGDDVLATDSGSAYVFVRSGSSWTQQTKLTAADAGFQDELGASVALSGDTALVGSIQDDDAGASSGAVYVFVRAGTAWVQQAKLVAEDGAANDNFGWDVALVGDMAVIGSHRDDDRGSNSGSAYLFVRSGSTWSARGKWTASDGGPGGNFGSGVAVSGDSALVGAPGRNAAYVIVRGGDAWSEEATLSPGQGSVGFRFGGSVTISGDTAVVGADQADNARGAAYVFERRGPTWEQRAKLQAVDGGPNDHFGWSVALDGDTLVVGAREDNDDAWDGGSAYVFVRSGGVWAQQAKLVPPVPQDLAFFGQSVAVSGDFAVVSAYGSDSFLGVVYVFERSGVTWAQRARLVAADGATSESFGWAVAVSGGTALVGAHRDDDGIGSAYVFARGSDGTWTQQAKLVADDARMAPWADWFGISVALVGDTALVGASQSNGAYVFERDGAFWTQTAKLVASDGSAGDGFGVSVALTDDRALVGAWGDDDVGRESGSAYVFERRAGVWRQEQKVLASDGEADDYFGHSVALSRDWTLVGAPGQSAPLPFGNRSGAVYFGALTERSANGETCAASEECASGFCVDGVCCDTACGAGATLDCMACSAARGAAADGTCGPTEGNPCDDGFACTLADVCEAGTCGGWTRACDPSTTCHEVGGGSVCGLCPAGSFSVDGSGATECLSCPAGTWSRTGATMCLGWSTCGAGTRVLAEGSSTSDRACVACEAGTYSTTPNAPTCRAWTVCLPGESVATVGSALSDQSCAPCAEGTFSSTSSSPSCAVWTSCGPGSHVVSEGSSTADRICAACDTGYTEESNQPSCVPWTDCAVNEFESGSGTRTSNRECTPCSECAPGEEEVSACTDFSDTVCTGSNLDAGTSPQDGGSDVGGLDAGVDDAGSDGGRGDGSLGDAGLEVDASGGCGCSTSRGAPSFELVLGIGWLSRRRRRSSRAAHQDQ